MTVFDEIIASIRQEERDFLKKYGIDTVLSDPKLMREYNKILDRQNETMDNI